MKTLLPAIGLVSFLMAQSASAHAHLEKSTPSENSVLTSAPTTLEMTFSEAARLTALSIQKDQDPKLPIKNLPTAVEPTVRVALPALAPGAYTVSWRVVSPDGHVMSGSLHFTIAAKR